MASPKITINEKVFESLPAITPGLTAIYIGTTNWGKIEEIQLANSLDRFNLLYGTQTERSFLYFAIKKFLLYSSNLYVARAAVTTDSDPNKAQKATAQVVASNISGNPLLLTISALYTGELGNEISVSFTKAETESGQPVSYSVKVYKGNDLVDTFNNCTLDENDVDNFIENKINGNSAYIEVAAEDTIPSDALITDSTITYILSGGQNGDIENANKNLETSIINILEKLKDKDKYVFDVIVVPDFSFSPDIIMKLNEVVTYRNDCVAIIDAPFGLGSASDPIQSVVDFHNGVSANSVKIENI